jgi:hypothetical protein
MEGAVVGQRRIIIEIITDRQTKLGEPQPVVDPVTDLELLVGQSPARSRSA